MFHSLSLSAQCPGVGFCLSAHGLQEEASLMAETHLSPGSVWPMFFATKPLFNPSTKVFSLHAEISFPAFVCSFAQISVLLELLFYSNSSSYLYSL